MTAIVESVPRSARGDEAAAIVDEFARRYSPGQTYGAAFMETLLDLIGERDPILVLDRSATSGEVARRLFENGRRRRADLAEALRARPKRRKSGREPVVPFKPDVFPFFAIEDGSRRRVEIDDLDRVAEKIARGEARVSADVLTRPS